MCDGCITVCDRCVKRRSIARGNGSEICHVDLLENELMVPAACCGLLGIKNELFQVGPLRVVVMLELLYPNAERSILITTPAALIDG